MLGGAAEHNKVSSNSPHPPNHKQPHRNRITKNEVLSTHTFRLTSMYSTVNRILYHYGLEVNVLYRRRQYDIATYILKLTTGKQHTIIVNIYIKINKLSL